jgi:hypothetical protein
MTLCSAIQFRQVNPTLVQISHTSKFANTRRYIAGVVRAFERQALRLPRCPLECRIAVQCDPWRAALMSLQRSTKGHPGGPDRASDCQRVFAESETEESWRTILRIATCIALWQRPSALLDAPMTNSAL